MRRLSTALVALSASAPALAMQQGAPPMPKVITPSLWPVAGYIFAGVMFVAAIFLSVQAANRSDPDSGEVS